MNGSNGSGNANKSGGANGKRNARRPYRAKPASNNVSGANIAAAPSSVSSAPAPAVARAARSTGTTAPEAGYNRDTAAAVTSERNGGSDRKRRRNKSSNGKGGTNNNNNNTNNNSEPQQQKQQSGKRNKNRNPRSKEATHPNVANDTDETTAEVEPMEIEAPPIQEAGESRHQFSDVPFSSLANVISDPSLRALKEVLKYELMTKVQAGTLPTVMSGVDVLAKAKTGSGKTTAFLLPICEQILNCKKMHNSRNRQVQQQMISALILSPTRELTNQIALEAKALTTFQPLNIVSLIGGTNIKADVKRLSGNVDIIVATPGRLEDHLKQNSVDIVQRLQQGLQCLCLDEADRLLDMGFRPELTRIIGYLPKERQTLLFSATLPDSLQDITALALKRNYEYINTVGEEESHTNVQVIQEYLICPLDRQIAALELLLRHHQQECRDSGYKIIVFFNTARTASFMAQLFLAAKFPVMEMHSRKSQSYRTKVAKDFTAQNNVMMFSSDVSARGVDYPGVTLIVQIGLTDREQYIHRLGRTARAGRQGRGVIVLGEFESLFLTKELKDLDIGKMKVPTEEEFLPSSSSCWKVLRTRNRDFIQSGEMAYQSFLGYYNSNLRRIGMDKVGLVKLAEEYSVAIGLPQVPALLAKTVGKMGLKGTPGLVIKRGN